MFLQKIVPVSVVESFKKRRARRDGRDRGGRREGAFVIRSVAVRRDETDDDDDDDDDEFSTFL